MASTLLFISRGVIYNATPGAGSGTIIQFTYTVPAGKRATLKYMVVQINGNANAANTTLAGIQAAIAGTTIRLMQYNGSGVAATATQAQACDIELAAGDTVSGYTGNTGVGAVGMLININVKEYQ